MAIKIIPEKIPEPPKDVFITSTDKNLIKRIRNQLGVIEAIKVTRWLTQQDLKTCKDFVESLYLCSDQMDDPNLPDKEGEV